MSTPTNELKPLQPSVMKREQYPQSYVDALNSEIAQLRASAEEKRSGWATCASNAQDAYALLRRMREFIYAYFIDGVLRFGEREGKPWTYREEARALLDGDIPEIKAAPSPAFEAMRTALSEIAGYASMVHTDRKDETREFALQTIDWCKGLMDRVKEAEEALRLAEEERKA